MAFRSQPVHEEVELEVLAETELSRLKRQYRIMENDRATYAEDARLQLRNQQNMINQLEFEKADLMLGIKTAKSGANNKKDEAMSEKLKCLLATRTKYKETIDNERQQINELEEQILKVSREVTKMKMVVQTDNQSKELAVKHKRMVNILENRLEVATKRFNMIVTDNKKFREEITSLLTERQQFNVLWLKLIGQLNTGKQVINDLVEQATVTFNMRDEELNKLHALRERGARDLKSHTSEMCELQRTLDNEWKLQEFLGVKGQYRDTGDLNTKKDAKKQNRQDEMQKKVAEYTHILELIKQFTGEDEIDRLMTHFVKQEEENFALFSYVNELNDELEGLQARVGQLRVAIDEARALNTHRNEQQAQTLDRIAKQLEEQTNAASKAEGSLAECNEVIEKLLRGIESLFRSVRCDNSPILELLGDNSHVTTNNVMLYLGIIEKRITDIFNQVHWVDKARKAPSRLDESKKPRLKIPVLSQVAPTQPCALCVEKEELQNVSEGLDAPLTREEASQKLNQRLADDFSELLHNVSGCHLPAARKIMQRRYQ